MVHFPSFSSPVSLLDAEIGCFMRPFKVWQCPYDSTRRKKWGPLSGEISRNRRLLGNYSPWRVSQLAPEMREPSFWFRQLFFSGATCEKTSGVSIDVNIHIYTYIYTFIYIYNIYRLFSLSPISGELTPTASKLHFSSDLILSAFKKYHLTPSILKLTSRKTNHQWSTNHSSPPPRKDQSKLAKTQKNTNSQDTFGNFLFHRPGRLGGKGQHQSTRKFFGFRRILRPWQRLWGGNGHELPGHAGCGRARVFWKWLLEKCSSFSKKNCFMVAGIRDLGPKWVVQILHNIRWLQIMRSKTGNGDEGLRIPKYWADHPQQMPVAMRRKNAT